MNQIMSGGQTGTDRAALDIAIALGIKYFGYIPRGRLAEDGIIPEKYKYLRETRSNTYEWRTEMNVQYSNATVIFYEDKLTPGSQLTINLCKKHDKPYKEIILSKFKDCNELRGFLNQYDVVNFAGSRESKSPGIYKKVYELLMETIVPKYVNADDVD